MEILKRNKKLILVCLIIGLTFGFIIFMINHFGKVDAANSGAQEQSSQPLSTEDELNSKIKNSEDNDKELDKLLREKDITNF